MKKQAKKSSLKKNTSLSFLTKFQYLNRILKPKEKIVIYLAVSFLIMSLVGVSVKYYISVTKTVPAIGGEYTEGIAIDSAGIPTTINPLLSITRPIDKLISSVVFSSFFTYDKEGQLQNDIIHEYSISEDGKKYTFKLRDNILWHDGMKLTANDVVFTVKLLQDASYNPVSTKEWDSSKITVSKSDDFTVVFDLSEPYAPFLSKLTFGILPKHLWSEISADSFSLADLNLEPIGSGPFIFDSIKKDVNGDISSYKLVRNKNYYNKIPYLEKLIFKFYSNKESLIQAYAQKEIAGFGLSDYSMVNEFNDKNDTSVVAIDIPQYFSILLNKTESIPLADEKVRQALQHATNRDELVESVFNGYANKIYSPLLKPFIAEDFNYDDNLIKYSLEDAEKLLEESGWKKEDGKDFRRKDDADLTIKLVTTGSSDLVKTVQIIKEQWRKVGVNVELVESDNKLNIRQEYLSPRKYESLLLGLEYSGNDPNLFFFWHSTGKKDPGLNFTLYDNEEVDKLLEESKKSTSSSEKNEKYIAISHQLNKDNPAIFLYSLKFMYVLNNKLKGVDITAIPKTTNRLSEITNWYTETKRVRK